jgi:hypothetical protein
MRDKPVYGSPCNNCGRCCVVSQCPLSVILFGERTLCPALVTDQQGGYVCGLVTTQHLAPAKRRAAVVAIGSGTGCDFAQTAEDLEARKTHHRRMFAASLAALEALPPGARGHFETWKRLGQ